MEILGATLQLISATYSLYAVVRILGLDRGWWGWDNLERKWTRNV